MRISMGRMLWIAACAFFFALRMDAWASGRGMVDGLMAPVWGFSLFMSVFLVWARSR